MLTCSRTRLTLVACLASATILVTIMPGDGVR
jgi:hypothetical protein